MQYGFPQKLNNIYTPANVGRVWLHSAEYKFNSNGLDI